MTPTLPRPVNDFFHALNTHSTEALARCLHQDFEMVVPQKPARGFVGRDQEVANMRQLFHSYPDFEVTILRSAVNVDEVWTETVATAPGLEVAAVVIWTVDPTQQVLLRGRYYSEPVQPAADDITEFIRGLTAGSAAAEE